MNRSIALLTTLMAAPMVTGAALAQTSATSTTTIGEVTLTKPVVVPTQAATETSTPETDAETSATDTTTETTVEPISPAQEVAPLQTTEAAQAGEEVRPAQSVQPVRTVTPPSSATPAASATQTAPRTAPVQTAPKAAATQTAPARTTTAQPAPARPAQPAPAKAAPVKAPAQAPVKPAAISTVASATAVSAPSDLPAGWRHLSGDIFGSKAMNLPAGSKVQVAIEAVNRATGQHTPHLLVDFGAEMLPTQYYLNYNPARMNTARYDYVVQAKVFDASGKMLYMSDARQPLPRDVAAKLKIDMRF
ncbi:hypothetical protein Deipr_1929 [Deinococcus proteolyticus MRP]|uniref:Uncharacterized protein n=1 Tax=Deinococcus proteolyticus (strain ATCC 35074 / DSM 20540 / JCM 6276 / NBRC 101906 / NCIMB 13154 / VKM Ac-1939 / CCM 2703 / MRP) TaxID=693977 RepID=F0RMC4_DEIPM|nr:YbaY family lipoprotein [Deinococcus proteolyticus]ADY27061.1 hypothetical protein Deipr_1929 [Deinococcus proteolyticus MRP]